MGPFWARHRNLFWALHSVWALAAGIVVLILAREHYGLVPWVVLFLVLAWASTLYFGRVAHKEDGGPPGFFHEVTSYFTRVLYHETLFFLLPFYAYSTVIDSPNVLFLILLGGLAIFSCIDLTFDRWLRTKPAFALMFFSIVAFSAINLILPLLAGVRPRFATPVAGILAVMAAVPLAWSHKPAGRGKLGLAAAALVILAVPLGMPILIPPVPLRLESATFASAFDRTALAPLDSLPDHARSGTTQGSLFVLVDVFAPSAVPASVRLDWFRDGQFLRSSREVQITAHEEGFRVWDGWHSESSTVPPGRYRVVLRTLGSRVFGVAKLTVDP